MRSLILHSLKMRKVQTVSVALSVVLSVAISLTLCLVYGGVTQGIELSGQRGGAQIMVIPDSAEKYVSDTELLYTGVPAPMYMDAGIVDEIASMEGVEQASAQFFSQTLNQSCCSATGETRLIGVDFSTDFVVTPLLPEGFSGQGLADDEVVVGCRVDGIVDGIITIVGKKYKVVATLAETGADLDSSIVADIDTARAISRSTAGYESYWEKYGDPDTLVSCIMINATDDDELYARLLNKLNLTEGIAFVEHSETAERAQVQLQSVFALLVGAAIIMVAVSLLQLFARFTSCVWDRKSELALYRALGASKADLKRLIGGEMAVIMGGGLVIGIILGFALYEGLIALLLDSLSFPFVGLGVGPVVVLILIIAAVFAAMAVAAIAWPLRQIGRIDPSLAMQQGDID